MPLFARSPGHAPPPPGGKAPAPRLLFLDDDPGRAEIFLAENPDAVWVQTAADCIAKLEETWDQVHLDHDLGGEHFVDLSREDCGMEVVRWLCLQPRPHLKATRFHVHSHNPNAATMMGMQMMMSGFTVEVRPFGSAAALPGPGAEPPPRLSFLASLGQLIRHLFGREDYGFPAANDEPARPDRLPMEQFNFNWMPPPTEAGDPDHGAEPGADRRSQRPSPSGG